MMAPVPLDRLAALIARAEERLSHSRQVAQQIGESLLQAQDATRRSRELLTQYRDELPREGDQAVVGGLARRHRRPARESAAVHARIRERDLGVARAAWPG